MESKRTFALYVRTFVFGVEDSVVSTVGLLSGVAVAGAERSTVLLSGLTLIFVEAFSMGMGSLLSEHQAEKYLKHREVPLHRSLVAGLVMFVSYLIAGMIPLAPYFFMVENSALVASVALSLLALFCLGVLSAFIFKTKLLRNGIEMLMIGGLAIMVGIAVGYFIDGRFS